MPRTPRLHVLVGAMQLFIATLLLLIVWKALPARYLPIDAIATALAATLAVGGTGLIKGASWGRAVSRSAALAAFVTGMALVTTLAWTVSYLAGMYGPVGAGGALILALSAALAIPYLVVAPALHLWLLRPHP